MNDSATALRPNEFVWATLEQLVGECTTVIDVGCGPALYRGAINGEYIGVDITDEPYREGVPRDVDVVAPADAMPFSDGSADALFTLGALLLMGDGRSALAEFHRVLAPGGRLLIFDYNRRCRRDLSRRSGEAYPPWTQWRLQREVRRAGFQQPRLLLPVSNQPHGLVRLRKLIVQELRGQWAIISAKR